MKKYALAFLISCAVGVLLPLAFWRLGKNSADIRYFTDYLFMSGVSLFLIGMILALAATSRFHYYLHLKSKFKGEVKDDFAFEKDEKKRKKLTVFGAIIAVSGILAFALSGYFSIKFY